MESRMMISTILMRLDLQWDLPAPLEWSQELNIMENASFYNLAIENG